MLPPPHYVKYLLRTLGARSSFRKTGPGVRARLREALKELNQKQLTVAKRQGWDKGMIAVNKNTGTLVVR